MQYEPVKTAGGQVVARDAARAAPAVIEQTAVDLLVADIGLPHEDGFWLIRRCGVKKLRADCLRRVDGIRHAS